MTAFTLAGVPVYRYGLAVAAAALAALLLMTVTARRCSLKSGTVSYFAVLAIPCAVLLGRVGYCLANLDWLLERGVHFFFQFARGGYMLYGALLGVLLAAWLTAKGTKQPAARILDAAAAPGALLTALGRLAESIIKMGYGHNIQEWFDAEAEKSMIAWEDPSLLYRFPLGAQDYYEEWNFAIFLPEALTALVILLVLLALKKRRDGGRILLAVLVYAGAQTIWESMRMDAVLRWGFVRVSQLLSAVSVAAVLLICWKNLPRAERSAKALLLPLCGVLLCCGVIMAMEFALEQKINFLTWMRMDLCYMVMALGSLGLILSVLPVWKKAYPEAA